MQTLLENNFENVELVVKKLEILNSLFRKYLKRSVIDFEARVSGF